MGLVLLKPSRRRNLCWRIKFTRRWKRRGDKKKNWSRRGLLYVSFFRRGGERNWRPLFLKRKKEKKTVNNLSHLISFSFLSGLLVYPQLNLNFSQVLIVIKSVHLRENAVIHFLLECKKHLNWKRKKNLLPSSMSRWTGFQKMSYTIKEVWRGRGSSLYSCLPLLLAQTSRRIHFRQD